jgi:Na+/H+ antiporter NhaD/arsenite permease-like protein
MATMNLIFSNVFDLKKLITEHNEGSIFTDFNGVVFLVSLFAFVTPVVVIPIVKKKKSAKESGRKGEDVAGSE